MIKNCPTCGRKITKTEPLSNALQNLQRVAIGLRNRDIVNAFHCGLSFVQIGKVLSLSPSRVRQICEKYQCQIEHLPSWKMEYQCDLTLAMRRTFL